MSANHRSAARPDYDPVIQQLADYTCDYEVSSETALETARYCLIDTLGCGLEALRYPACCKLLGPVVPGADMIGQIEFNSATFYRYAVLDINKLLDNLQGDRELALSAIEAFATAFVRAVPTGKQNTFAAHNAPDFIGVSLRHVAPMSLANAFEKPVVADLRESLTEQSVQRLQETEKKLSAVYSDGQDQWLHLDLTGRWAENDQSEAQANLVQLAQRVREIADTALEG